MLQLSSGYVFHDRYRIVRLIKAGGMGAVYEAVDLRSDRRRALKILLPSMLADQDVRARFDREARLTGAIDSDHLVEVSDAGVDEASNAPFIAMELLRGQDLETLLREGKRPAPAEVVSLLAQAALALDKTHAAGIVHRDLKPENLFLTRREDGSVCLKVLDFGAAKKVATQGTGAGATRVLGTPLYMPPEQSLGRPDLGPAVDLYALAHIAFVLLVGSHYWRDEQRAMEVLPFLIRSAQGNPEPASVRAQRAGAWLPPAFDAWFDRATAVEPRGRYHNASDMVSALGFALGVSRAGPLVPGEGMVPSALSASQPIANPPTQSSAFTRSSAAFIAAGAPKKRGVFLLGGAIALGMILSLGLVTMLKLLRPGSPGTSEAGQVATGQEAAAAQIKESAATSAPAVSVTIADGTAGGSSVSVSPPASASESAVGQSASSSAAAANSAGAPTGKPSAKVRSPSTGRAGSTARQPPPPRKNGEGLF